MSAAASIPATNAPMSRDGPSEVWNRVFAVQGDHRHTVAGKPEDRSEFGLTNRGSGAPEQHHLGSVRPVHPDGWNAVEVFGEVTVVHHQTTSVGELLGE